MFLEVGEDASKIAWYFGRGSESGGGRFGDVEGQAPRRGLVVQSNRSSEQKKEKPLKMVLKIGLRLGSAGWRIFIWASACSESRSSRKS